VNLAMESSARFQTTDTNHDHTVSRDEWIARNGNDALFDAYDANHDGTVSAEEFVKSQTHFNLSELATKEGWLKLCCSNGTHQMPPLRELAMAVLFIACVDYALALALGIYLNQSACDQTWTCDQRGIMSTKDIWENGLGDGNINFLNSPCKTAAVAISMTIAIISIRFVCHPRIHGFCSFIIFVSMFSSILSGVYGDSWTAGSWPENSQIGAQFRNIAENAWEPGSSWDEILSSGDFYAWLRNPMKDLLFAGDANSGCGPRARANPGNSMTTLAPTVCNRWETSQVWLLIGCQMRQVRVRSKPTAGTSMENLPFFGGVTETYPKFDLESQEMESRAWNNSAGELKQEAWINDKLINAFMKKMPSPTFRGGPLIGTVYPGQSGQTYGGDFDYHNKMGYPCPGTGGNPYSVNKFARTYYCRAPYCCPNDPYGAGSTNCTCGSYLGPWPGWWNGFNSPSPDGSKFVQDINDMESSWWIDEKTRLVQYACRGVNANTNQNFLMYYSLEISAAGLFNPLPPTFSSEILMRNTKVIWDHVNSILLFACFYLNEELYEIYLYSFRKYFIETGWLNALDWIGIVTALGAYVGLGNLVVFMPHMYSDPYAGLTAHRKGHMGQVVAQSDAQMWLGFTVFLICFKSLKFTKNIPVMSYIGNTFSNAVTEIAAFGVVIFILIGAFAALFNILLAGVEREFGTFLQTMDKLTNDGLRGDLPSDVITLYYPFIGPIIYAMYLMCVLFVGFTILISIIADRYQAAIKIPTKEGLAILAYNQVTRWADKAFPLPRPREQADELALEQNATNGMTDFGKESDDDLDDAEKPLAEKGTDLHAAFARRQSEIAKEQAALAKEQNELLTSLMAQVAKLEQLDQQRESVSEVTQSSPSAPGTSIQTIEL